MRLADFIENNITEIVDEAEEFAKTLNSPGRQLDSKALRDHIPDMLRVMVVDLRTEQTDEQAQLKSKGAYAPIGTLARTAAQIHAGTRADQGFDIAQLVSEYRVLRASILRLWTQRHQVDGDAIEDINRFNEAIDQAIAESVGTFSGEIDRWRNVFLGILGHELRGPLSAILIASEMLGGLTEDGPVAKNVARIIDGGERMRALLNDLLDFNRVSFGLDLLINRAPVELAEVCAKEIELVRTNWPDHQIDFATSGKTQGLFDASRVREVIWNLTTNAAKYGDADRPINVILNGDANCVKITVQNGGPGICASHLGELFEPLRRASSKEAVEGSLGLGLFVVKQVAIAHGGDVEVKSIDGMTEFVVSLRRSAEEPHSIE